MQDSHAMNGSGGGIWAAGGSFVRAVNSNFTFCTCASQGGALNAEVQPPQLRPQTLPGGPLGCNNCARVTCVCRRLSWHPFIKLCPLSLQISVRTRWGGAQERTSLILIDCVFSSCSATTGGGFALDEGVGTLHGLSVSNCSAKTAGAVHVYESLISIEGCSVSDCRAVQEGGGIDFAFSNFSA
eukprot:5955457-Pleurochrysis_carterae.AAC.1